MSTTTAVPAKRFQVRGSLRLRTMAPRMTATIGAGR
jgi:hypothetical protein